MPYLLILTLILAPAYVIKLKLASLPTDVLMVWVFLFCLGFFLYLVSKKQSVDFWKFIKNLDSKILIFTALFFFSGIIGLFFKGIDRAKLGQFIVLFLEPILVFLIGAFVVNKYPKTKNYLLTAVYSLLALAGLLAILQYFTLLGLPPAYWGNSQEPKRALSFFIHPNFYALWSAPLLALLIPDVGENLKFKLLNLKSIGWALGAIGLLLSFSRAGWLGLSAAVAIYSFVVADKKIKRAIFSGVVVIVLIIIAVPNLRWRVILPLYGEKSASSRVELWQSGWRGIKESPILGLGLNGYANKYRALQTDTALPDHNFPHNIFLDFWVETGLLGLISFIGIAWLFIFRGFKNRSNLFTLGVSLFLVAMIVQGQIDNPYFKNDLALVFWMILSLGI